MQPLEYWKNPQEDNLSGKHHSRRSRRRGDGSKRRLILILGLALAIETLLLLTVFIGMLHVQFENSDLLVSGRKQAEELETLRPQVNKLQEEIAALTESRLPGVQRLELDKVLTVDDAYVRNVVFSSTGKGDELQYEYKMVLHNASLNGLYPQVDILFFDRVGLQIGIARTGPPKVDALDPGETRSYSGKVELTNKVKPNYYRIRISK